MGVDVVIVNWNGGAELVRAVESVLRFGGNPIVVDNDSTVGTIDEVQDMVGVNVTGHERNWFAAACS